MKLIGNPTDKQVAVFWGHTPYYVPPKQAIPVEDIIANSAEKNEDYKDLIYRDVPSGESPENAAKDFTVELNGGEPPSKPGPERIQGSKDIESDWNPLECDFAQVEAFAEDNGLVLDPDASEDDVRQIVDEFLQS